MILLSSSQLAFSHCPLEKEQQLSWAGECREALWGWGCQSVIHRGNKEKEESRAGLEISLSYLVTHLQVALIFVAETASKDENHQFRR